LDRWISTIKPTVEWVIAYCMDPNWALREVQLASNEIDRMFCSTFESQLRMISQGPTYWSNGSRAYEGHASLFWAYSPPLASNHRSNCCLKLLDDTRAGISCWGLQIGVVCIEERHTIHWACLRAGARCIQEQSQCKRPYQVSGSPWAQSGIWREPKHR
jgi:hypothetical protein